MDYSICIVEGARCSEGVVFHEPRNSLRAIHILFYYWLIWLIECDNHRSSATITTSKNLSTVCIC